MTGDRYNGGRGMTGGMQRSVPVTNSSQDFDGREGELRRFEGERWSGAGYDQRRRWTEEQQQQQQRGIPHDPRAVYEGLGDARLRMPGGGGGGPGAPPGPQDRQHMYQGGYPRDFDRGGPRGPMPGQRMPGGGTGMGPKGQAELAMQAAGRGGMRAPGPGDMRASMVDIRGGPQDMRGGPGPADLRGGPGDMRGRPRDGPPGAPPGPYQGGYP